MILDCVLEICQKSPLHETVVHTNNHGSFSPHGIHITVCVFLCVCVRTCVHVYMYQNIPPVFIKYMKQRSNCDIVI